MAARFLNAVATEAENPSRSNFGLTADLLEKARARLTFVALLFVIFCTLASILVYAFARQSFEFLFGVYLLNGLVSLLMFVLGKNRRLRHDLVLNLGLAYEVLLCLVVSLGYILSDYHEFGKASDITWVCILIVMFPLLIPCTPRRTLVTALAAAATVPLGLFIVDRMTPLTTVATDFILISISPFFCAIIAVAGSRLIYRLNVDVAEATRMGSYQLVELIGRGGMGEVWKADHRILARPAAVKLVRPDLLGAVTPVEQQSMLKRFEREAQVTANLNSPHTVALYDFGATDEGVFYYVMELLAGLDLETFVRDRFGPLPQARAVHILLQLCDSLADAHHSNLIHRDIKPANVFLCRKGLRCDFVKVLDFGLVALRDRSDTQAMHLTTEGMISGTPAYLSPESVQDAANVDARTDIYAVGCLAFWLLTGRTVFEGETAMNVILAHVNTMPQKPSAVSELEIAPALDTIILDCLAKDPDQRPKDALELSRRLAACELNGTWTDGDAREWWSLHCP